MTHRYYAKIKSIGNLIKLKTVISSSLISLISLLIFSTLALAEGGGRYLSQDAWSFGVMADTQWTIAEDTLNPNFVAGSILTQVDNEFIRHGVKFVIALGDMSDRAKEGAMATRAEYAKALYDAGIGFFPMRGNHETYGWLFSKTPVENEIAELLDNFPQTKKEMFGVSNLSSPTTLDRKYNDELKGLSYSFDFGQENNNVRFVFLDTEDVRCEAKDSNSDGSTSPFQSMECKNYPIPSQQDWINDRLNKSSRNTTHAIVLAHRVPISQNHTDSPFNPNTLFGQKAYGLDHNPEAQNIFFESMYINGAKLYLGAHDHIHHRSIIKSPDGKFKFQEVIAAGLSTKFYEPAPIPNPKKDRQGNITIPDQWSGQKSREIPLSQESKNIGYYVYTVDGPRLIAEYYSDAKGHFQSGNSYPYGDNNPKYPKGVTPGLNFIKKETFGYSLNGREFLVKQGEPYTAVQDSMGKTKAGIIAGFNSSVAKDGNNRGLTKSIETGWVKSPDQINLKSNIFSIWGMSELGSNGRTDIYVLSVSIDKNKIPSLKKGKIGVATFVNGKWVNAVDENFGGEKKFIVGKYEPRYGLGTYGIDPKTKTAWAVLNYNADFAVAADMEQLSTDGE